MNIKLLKKNFDLYDDFVKVANNGTIFHKQRFLSYHSKNRFNYARLLFVKDKKIIAVITGSMQDNHFISPAGSSYGSFAVSDFGFKTYEEVIDKFLSFCKKHGINKITLTPPPLIYLDKKNQIESFLLSYKGFQVKQSLVTNALYIKDLKRDDVMNCFSDMHRRAVLKSIKKGVIVKKSKNYSEFYEMLLENKKKFKTIPTHTLEEIVTIKSLFPKDIDLLMAYSKDKKPIAGIWAIQVNKQVGLAFYICHYYANQELRAVNRLLYELILWAKKRKLEWIDLGVSMDTLSKNPMEPSRNLIFFKEGIGSRGFLRTTYQFTTFEK